MNFFDTNQFILFVAFVIPGFISLKVYDLLYPSENFDSTKRIIEAVTFSCFNYAILYIPIYHIERLSLYDSSPFLYATFYIITLLVFPILLALLASKIRNLKCIQNRLPHPQKTPWDFVFQQRLSYWLIIELKDGEKIAGKYSNKSFTSSYPTPQQIYLEEKWILNEDGGLERPRDRTAGVLISSEQIISIELFN